MSHEAGCSKNMDDFNEENKATDLNENDEERDYFDDVPEFMDHFGNHWDFACKIRDGNHLKKCCRIMGGGMVIRKETKLIRRFQCQMNKECQFKAIFVKPSFLYTLNVHNHQRENADENDLYQHEEMADENDEEEPSFMDNFDNLWNFACKIRDGQHLKEWCQQMGGLIPDNEEKLTQQFNCQNNECQFKAIFLKASSNVYTRNEHNHGIENAVGNIQKRARGRHVEIPKNVGDDYVDGMGKIWTFREEIGTKNVQINEKNILQEIYTKYGLSRSKTYQSTLYLRCEKKGPNGEKCKFKGIYLKENGCLHTRGEHNHIQKIGKGINIPKNVGDDYVDPMGKTWTFQEEIGKNIQREALRTKYGFNKFDDKKSTMNLHCQKNSHKGAEGCKFAGVYVKENGCLYTRGEHNHNK